MALCFLRLKKSTPPLSAPTVTVKKTGLYCTRGVESHVLATDNKSFTIEELFFSF